MNENKYMRDLVKRFSSWEAYVEKFSAIETDSFPKPSDLANLVSDGKTLSKKELEALSADMGFTFEDTGCLDQGNIAIYSDHLFGIIKLNRETSASRQKWVLAHELGHVFVRLFAYANNIPPINESLTERSELEEKYVSKFADSLVGFYKK